jgi:hypothetical protein
MEQQILDILLKRLDKLECKVDRLLAFRAWIIGAAAGLGAVASVVTDWIRGVQP